MGLKANITFPILGFEICSNIYFLKSQEMFTFKILTGVSVLNLKTKQEQVAAIRLYQLSTIMSDNIIYNKINAGVM